MISFVSSSSAYIVLSVLLSRILAIVTHKGAAADAGHYIGFVKKSVFHSAKPTSDGPTLPGGTLDDEDDDWYKFDDDKVSIFPKEKLPTLEGGGGFPFRVFAGVAMLIIFIFIGAQAKTRRRMCWFIKVNRFEKRKTGFHDICYGFFPYIQIHPLSNVPVQFVAKRKHLQSRI